MFLLRLQFCCECDAVHSAPGPGGTSSGLRFVYLGARIHAQVHPLKPPPPTNELPSLRFKPQDEADEIQDDSELYGDVYDEPSRVWVWAKRLVILAVLGGGGFFAAITRESWVPVVDRWAMGVMGTIDNRLRPPSPPAAVEESDRQRRQEALAAATEQMPQLSAETIQLVMEGSLAGILDPLEVFHRAQDALERGRSQLAPEEAEELKALQAEVFGALTAADRGVLREYDATRGMRATLPFEDRQAMTLIGRGARALPAERLDRLRLLSAKAIVAAPAAGTAPVPPAPASPEAAPASPEPSPA